LAACVLIVDVPGLYRNWQCVNVSCVVAVGPNTTVPPWKMQWSKVRFMRGESELLMKSWVVE
jgi:hypothetical protein